MREPSWARERREAVEGSKAREEELKRSRPANAPASPTWPMRSKSTFGRAARAERGERWRRARASLFAEARRDRLEFLVMAVGGEET